MATATVNAVEIRSGDSVDIWVRDSAGRVITHVCVKQPKSNGKPTPTTVSMSGNLLVVDELNV